MNLHLLVIVPVLTAIAILFFNQLKHIRLIALCGAVIQFTLSILLLNAFCAERALGNNAAMVFYSSVEWFTPLGIAFTTGVDGISVSMILLSAFVVLAGVLVSWKMEKMWMTRSLLTVSSDLQVQRLIPGVEAGKVSLEDIMDTTIRSEWKMVF